jgi:hypothetical protein
LLGAEAGAETAVPHKDRGGAVAHYLWQGGLYVDLEVKVSVDIEHAWDQPLTASIDYLCGRTDRQVVAPRSDLAIAHRYILNARQQAAAVKNLGALNQQIPILCHGVAP